jgi:hypothetical protein
MNTIQLIFAALVAILFGNLGTFTPTPVQAQTPQQSTLTTSLASPSALWLDNQSVVSPQPSASSSIYADTEPSETEPDSQETNNSEEEPTITELPLDGQPIEGALTEKSQQLSDGSYLDIYSFQGQAGQEINIDLSSQGLNPVLSILRVNQNSEDPDDISFEEVASNTDLSPNDFNAKLSTKLQQDGNYLVVLTTASIEQTGTYTLNATTNL